MTDTDQWESAGDCKQCRKAKYCRKMCGANKRRLQAAVNSVLLRQPAIGAVYTEMMTNGRRNYYG